ncbi:chalcone isomerase family protein [Pseudomonas sp. XK-1]|uniref:chalcone isomerase family protein n=1 Tax=Pseudomonas sp. XK-1 TaxID=3136019 RepID=UPI0031198305
MRQILVLATLLLLSGELLANTSERLREANFAAQHTLSEASLERKNQSVLTYLWVDVYAAAFYAPAQTSASQAFSRPLKQRLELYYFRNIAREDVIKAAWTTLNRQHSPATLARLRNELDALHDKFQDIQPGDRYALNFAPESGLSLERNGQIAFTSQDPELARAYLGIWLAPNGLSDTLRNQLLAR